MLDGEKGMPHGTDRGICDAPVMTQRRSARRERASCSLFVMAAPAPSISPSSKTTRSHLTYPLIAILSLLA